MIKVLLPIRTTTESNTTGHWRPKAKRAKAQREQVGWFMAAALAWTPGTGKEHPIGLQRARAGWVLPSGRRLRVFLIRIAPSRLDVDNNVSSMKHIIDQIAASIGIDDRDDRVEWLFSQRKGAVREYGVEVILEKVGG
jgi:hypothetical protein